MSQPTIINPLAGLGPVKLWSHPLSGGELLIPSDPFGSPRGGHNHGGIDYAGKGMQVCSPCEGRITRAGLWQDDTGIMVAVTSASQVTHELLHLSRTAVKTGQNVKAGELVGISGNTGTRETSRGRVPVAWHLHWQTRVIVGDEAFRLLTDVRALPQAASNHPAMLKALNDALQGNVSTLRALLRAIQREGLRALPPTYNDNPVA